MAVVRLPHSIAEDPPFTNSIRTVHQPLKLLAECARKKRSHIRPSARKTERETKPNRATTTSSRHDPSSPSATPQQTQPRHSVTSQPQLVVARRVVIINSIPAVVSTTTTTGLLAPAGTGPPTTTTAPVTTHAAPAVVISLRLGCFTRPSSVWHPTTLLLLLRVLRLPLPCQPHPPLHSLPQPQPQHCLVPLLPCKQLCIQC